MILQLLILFLSFVSFASLHPQKIGFFSFGAVGHVSPLLPLCVELAQRGYNVKFHTHQHLRDMVENYDSGISFVSLGALPVKQLTFAHRPTMSEMVGT